MVAAMPGMMPVMGMPPQGGYMYAPNGMPMMAAPQPGMAYGGYMPGMMPPAAQMSYNTTPMGAAGGAMPAHSSLMSYATTAGAGPYGAPGPAASATAATVPWAELRLETKVGEVR